MVGSKMATEVQMKLEEDGVAKALANFDMDKTMKFFVGLIEVLGEVAVKLGTMEEENQEVPELLKIMASNPKLFLNKILEKASGDEVKTLIITMLKLDELTPKLSNLFMLKPEDKKKIGIELISVSKEIEEVYKTAKQKSVKDKT